MAIKEGVAPFFYLLLSVVGLALSAIVLSTKPTQFATLSAYQASNTYTYASVLLAFTVLGTVISVFSLVLGCLRKASTEPATKTTTSCKEVSTDLFGLVLGLLLMGLSGVVVSYGTSVPSSSYAFAAVVLALSCACIVGTVTLLSLKAREMCKERLVN